MAVIFLVLGPWALFILKTEEANRDRTPADADPFDDKTP